MTAAVVATTLNKMAMATAAFNSRLCELRIDNLIEDG